MVGKICLHRVAFSFEANLPDSAAATTTTVAPATEGQQVTKASEFIIEKIAAKKGAVTLDEETRALVIGAELEAKRIVEANIHFVEIPKSEKKVMEDTQ